MIYRLPCCESTAFSIPGGWHLYCFQIEKFYILPETTEIFIPKLGQNDLWTVYAKCDPISNRNAST